MTMTQSPDQPPQSYTINQQQIIDKLTQRISQLTVENATLSALADSLLQERSQYVSSLPVDVPLEAPTDSSHNHDHHGHHGHHHADEADQHPLDASELS